MVTPDFLEMSKKHDEVLEQTPSRGSNMLRWAMWRTGKMHRAKVWPFPLVITMEMGLHCWSNQVGSNLWVNNKHVTCVSELLFSGAEGWLSDWTGGQSEQIKWSYFKGDLKTPQSQPTGIWAMSSVSSKKEETTDCSRKCELNRSCPDPLLHWGSRRLSLRSTHSLLREQEPCTSLAASTSVTEKLLTLCLCYWQSYPEHSQKCHKLPIKVLWTGCNIVLIPTNLQMPLCIIGMKITKAPWNLPKSCSNVSHLFLKDDRHVAWRPVLYSRDMTPLSFFSTNSSRGLRLLLNSELLAWHRS